MAELTDRLRTLDPKRLALLTMELQSRLDVVERARREPIAVVGMGCRMPGGVDGPDAYWRLLRDGVDAVAEVPSERWDIEALYDPDPDAPGRMSTCWGGFLSDVALFDARLFGISPREATSMDPQQRILLEVVWETFERAGYAPDRLSGSRTGVFVGCSGSDYRQLHGAAGDLGALDAYVLTGTALNAVAGRIAYAFGLRGPTLVVDTACSSSLVSVHLACQSLRSGESDLALAGGVNLILVPDATVVTSRARMMAADGRCKTFDAAADGFVRGEGAGVVFLKRLSDAQADGDGVLAVIRGSAVNQDGPRSGFSVPNGLAQEALIRRALETARVDPAEVGYVEAHGTGTSLGDPIEMHALGAALGEGRSADSPLLVGSVKTNIGHTEAAAGIAGLIKTVLALQHSQIPPHLNFRHPSPHIAWDDLPVQVPTQLTPWPTGAGGRRIAGVSSFGMGGTNAHVVLEAAPDPGPVPVAPESMPRWQVLPLAARTEPALRMLAGRFADYLRDTADLALADVAYSAGTGRAQLPVRLAVLAGSTEHARAILRDFAAGLNPAGAHVGLGDQPPVPDDEELVAPPATAGPAAHRVYLDRLAAAWAQGASVDWATALDNPAAHSVSLPTYPFEREHFWIETPVARRPREGDAHVHPLLGARIRSPLFDDIVFQSQLAGAEFLLDHRVWGTPILPAAAFVEIALAAAKATGRPTSLAELIIAEALPLAQDTSRTVQTILSAPGQHPATFRILSSPDTGTHSWIEHAKGTLTTDAPAPSPDGATLAQLRQRCTEEVPAADFYRRLHEVGFEFGVGFQRIQGLWRAPGEVLGQVAIDPTADEGEFTIHPAVLDACFQVVGVLLAELDPDDVMMPIGVGNMRVTGRPTPVLWSHAVVRPDTVGSEGTRTFAVRLLDDAGHVVAQVDSLVFRRASRAALQSVSRTRLHDLFYQAHWQPIAPSDSTAATSIPVLNGVAPQPAPPAWLIFADDGGVGDRLARLLGERGEVCVLVRPLDGAPSDVSALRLDPADLNSVQELLSKVGPTSRHWREIIYLWGLDEPAVDDPTSAQLTAGYEKCCGRLLRVVQGIAGTTWGQARLRVVTRGAQAVGPSSVPLALTQAMIWGLGRVVMREHPELRGSLVDLDPESADHDGEVLLRELLATDLENQIALRDGARYGARLVRHCAPPTEAAPTLRVFPTDATYLVTGGLGKIGILTAQWLVQHGARNLVLVGRNGPSGEAADAIAKLECVGARILVRLADVAVENQIGDVVLEIEQTLPRLRGVIHAAGVLDDGILRNQSWQRFSRVLAPKVRGAWNLHRSTRQHPLDFFVLFSSMSALFGTIGQSNYAAANAFLDALAHHRQALGLPAVAVNWGPWASGGMAASKDVIANMRDWGMREIDPAEAFAALDHALTTNPTQLGVLRADWDVVLRQFPRGLQPPFLGEIAAEVRPADLTQESQEASAQFLREILEAEPNRQLDMLQERIAIEVAGVLRLDHDQAPAPRDRFFEIGMDSLMAVELRSRLEALLGCTLPATVVFDYPSIAALTQRLGSDVFGLSVVVAEPKRARTVAAREAAVAQLDQLSEDELAAVLDQELARFLEGKQQK